MKRFWLVLGMGLMLGASAWAGDIAGAVTVDLSKLPPRSKNTNPDMKKNQGQYKKSDLTKARAGGDGGAEKLDERDNVIVFLTRDGDGAKLKATPKQRDVLQENREFKAHVTPVVLGSTVRFVNKDSFFHHIYCPDSSKLNVPQHSTHVERKPDRLGKFELFCDIHPLMNGYVFVVPNDFVTVARSGSFTLKGVPAGTYTVEAWHPRVKSKSSKVTVPASGKVEVNFAL
jgi:plastocyanin